MISDSVKAHDEKLRCLLFYWISLQASSIWHSTNAYCMSVVRPTGAFLCIVCFGFPSVDRSQLSSW